MFAPNRAIAVRKLERAPDRVLPSSFAIPPSFWVDPLMPVVPFSMPLTRSSMPLFAGTRPFDTILNIASVVTPAVFARIFKAGTPASARLRRSSLVTLPMDAI